MRIFELGRAYRQEVVDAMGTEDNPREASEIRQQMYQVRKEAKGDEAREPWMSMVELALFYSLRDPKVNHEYTPKGKGATVLWSRRTSTESLANTSKAK